MTTRLPRVALWLLLLALLSGCGAQSPTLEEAAASARAFMESRLAGDADAAFQLLTARAQTEIRASQIARLFRGAEATYSDLGSPREVETGVVRIPVTDLVLTEPERTVRWPETWLTLRWEENRWRVAWAEPLFAEAAQAYFNDLATDELTLARKIIAIDPYHYRGYLEQHFAYREMERLREAEVALLDALERATPVELPDVHDAIARFKLAVNRPSEAIASARSAVELSMPYSPGTYSPRWQADTLVVAGRAALAANDLPTARALAGQAASLDADNANVAMLRHQLATWPSLPTAGR